MNKRASLMVLAIAASLLAFSFPLYTMYWIYPHFTKIITFEKEVNAKQIATHISKMLIHDRTISTLTRESISGDFVEVMKEAQSDFDLTEIKVFSAQGEVLYSTDGRDVGALNTNPYFTDIVAKGNIFSKVVRKNEKTMEEKTVSKDVVETYVPLMRGQQFLGAFEIYYDITYSEHHLSRFIEKSRIIVLAISLLAIVCIVFITASAIVLFNALHRTKRELQDLKDRVPALYGFPRDNGDQ